MADQTPPGAHMTYAGTGVDYDAMDPFKRMCQLRARRTAGNIARTTGGLFTEFEPSRGESAFLIESDTYFLGHVEEGLGTKNLVADAMQALTGKSYYDHIAQCTVAMAVNDLVTVGAMPMSVAMHLAVGSSDWFDDQRRAEDLADGWFSACNLARCNWGGGETPTLKGCVVPGAVVLSASATGIVRPKSTVLTGNKIRLGDAIIFAESSGIHANGLTLARSIADRDEEDPLRLPDGYMTLLPDGRTYGETLLDPTHIYVGWVADCLDEGVDVHYAVNVTGHGWRKFMRANEPFTYRINRLPTRRPIFDFIEKHGPVEEREMYANYNMGVGFALIVPEREVDTVLGVAETNDCGYDVFVAGRVEEGPKRVVIEPLGMEFSGETLAVR